MPLFTGTGAVLTGSEERLPRVIRARPVDINPLFFEGRRLEAGVKILVAPFEGSLFLAVLEQSGTDINGVHSFRARVEGTEAGYLFLSTLDGFALGLLNIPEWGMKFEVAPVPDKGLHVVREVEASIAGTGEMEDGPPVLPPEDSLPASTPPPDSLAAAAAEVNIDLMIVYTPAASNYASAYGGINLVISQALMLAQLALDSSDSGIRLRLVFSSQVNYQESGSSYTDLDRLTYTSDGYMDEVHGWRNLYGADLVNLLAEVEDVGGLGWLLTTFSGLPTNAFCLVRVQQAAATYTLVHELGHNFGCHHRKDQADFPGPGISSYSAGWRWIGSDNIRYCSVMSYTDTWDGQYVNRAPYFSSPLILYKGVATGHAANGDNARTLRETKQVVANYRAEVGGDLWLTITANTGGTTLPAPGRYSYPSGSVVLITAQPFTRYLFGSWSGNASGSANPVSITMNESKTVTANFLRIIYPPLNAQGRKVLNRSLSQAEYINVLTWEPNPDNENIVNYKIYRVQGQEKTTLAHLNSDVFEFRERGVAKDRTYTYWVVAVNSEWREGEPAVLEVR